jgi:hypothetical protein
MSVRLYLLALILLTLSVAADAAEKFSAAAIAGRVVEARSGIPLEGVIVVVNWGLLDASGLPVRQLAVAEVLTDPNGRFTIPAWGPKPAPTATALDHAAPQLLLFKEGYQYLRLTNQENTDTPHLTSDWSAKTLIMRRLPADEVASLGPGRTVSKHSLSASGLSAALVWAYRGKACEWKQIPRMLVAVDRLKRRFERQGLRTDLRSIDDIASPKACGTPRDVLRSYLGETP